VDCLFAIGVDVGGTKIAAGLVSSETAAVVARRSGPTAAWRGGVEVLGDAIRLAEGVATAARELGIDPAALGVGVPELVDLEGRITSSTNFDWRGIDVAAAFSHVAPPRVESDVRAAAIAEAVAGAGCAYATFVYVTIGTGVSHALVVDGRPYSGSRGAAILLGSSVLDVPCRTCGSPATIVLEDECSGPALVRDFTKRGGRAEHAEDVVAAAASGDRDARNVLERAGRLVGAGVGLLVNVLDPEAVVVGGGLGSAQGAHPYWDALVDSARAHVWSPEARSLPIVRARLGVDSGLVGAALAAL
jgi:glucokinase